jgi:hypothetical protein
MRAPRLDAAELRTVRRPVAAPVRLGFFYTENLTFLDNDSFSTTLR